ncbi:MAG: hypothetical protein CHACPFDD_00907 [Phycisphaerae bacterium]|nr:hypothetical protein [Phycisphaerae bacterium]
MTIADGRTPADPAEVHPAWGEIRTAVHCPRCDYNLYMLESSRCPECGLDLHWPSLISRAREHEASARQCGLFECRWRQRPVTSLLRSLVLSLVPWRLWRRRATLLDPLGWPGLIGFATLAVILLVVANTSVETGSWAASVWLEGMPKRVTMQHLSQWWRRTATSSAGHWPAMRLPLLLALSASMLIYRVTVCRFRLRWVHLQRVVIYSSIGALLLNVLVSTVLSAAWLGYRCYTWPRQGRLPAILFTVAIWLPPIFLVASLTIGFHLYLKLRRGWLAAAASLLLVGVVMMAADAVLALANDEPLQPSIRCDVWLPGVERRVFRLLAGA